MPKMFEAGLHGRKSKKGFYNYNEKKGRLKKSSPNQDVYNYFGNPKSNKLSSEEITERTMLMLLNEAVWCLEDNILQNAKDGDIGAVLGVGLARGIGALNLRMIGSIFLSWVVTLPAGAGLAIVFFFFFKGVFS